jgi:fibronectin-binding autotransporter adhesin
MNITPRTRELSAAVVGCLSLALLPLQPARAAVDTWTGGGANSFWVTPANWNTPPSAGDSLIFGGTIQLVNSNNFTAGTLFNNLTFASPAGGFVLLGNPFALGGSISNNQVVTIETINTGIILSNTPTIDVVTNGALTLGGVVSGNFGLNKVDGGLLTLNASNTFTGSLTVSGGKVSVTNDASLGAVPGSPTAGAIVLNGGTLQTTNGFTINRNRGISVGPSVGSGSGAIDVGTVALGANLAVTYGGIIANNGAGTGGLIKRSFGGLILAGPNTYTGPTEVKNGTLTLDFSAATAPANNIINSSSALTLGGEVSGAGVTNWAALVVNGNPSGVNTQSFAKTTIDIGQTYIRANSNAASVVTVRLGALTNLTGGFVNFITPQLLGGQGNITTTTTNVNGILGGWATVSDGVTPGNRLPSAPEDFAAVDASGNIVRYTNYTVYASGNLSAIMWVTNNILVKSNTSGDIIVDVAGAGSTNDVNSISFNRPGQNATGAYRLVVGSNNVVRLGKTGALHDQYNDVGFAWAIGNGTGATIGPQQGAGMITAGGPTLNTDGELILIRDNTGSGATQDWSIDSEIANNGTGVVTVVKAGPGFMKFRGHNTYTGGTYLLQGRLQPAGNDLTTVGGTINADAFGTGDFFLFPGGNIFFAGTPAPPAQVVNRFFVGGAGSEQEPEIGAIRTVNAWLITNTITLIGDTTIGGNGGTGGAVPGKITGPFSLKLCSGGTVTGTVSISNPSNNWTGDTIIQGRFFGAQNGNVFINGTNDCLPNGFGKGNVILQTASGGNVTWRLNGFNETINGLSTAGVGQNAATIQNNSASIPSTLTVGDNDQSGTFSGVISDGGTAPLALTKIGGGVLTLGGTNTFSGNTTINAGTLALGSNSAMSNSVIVVNSGGTFNIAAAVLPTFSTPKTVTLDSGALIGNSGPGGIGTLNLTNSQITLIANGTATNIFAGALTVGGATNVVNLTSVLGVTGYPTKFSVIKYTSFTGLTNFGLGSVPSATTGGFFSNDIVNSQIVLVLTNGPKLQVWQGNAAVNPSWWDLVTSNWLAFGIAPPTTFNTADTAQFDDSASNSVVNLMVSVAPSLVLISNNTMNYTIVGTNAGIGGFGALTKLGSGTATFLTTGDNYRNGVTVNAGTLVLAKDNIIVGGVTIATGATLQIGTNGGGGTLPAGPVALNGNLIFSRGADVDVNNVISGTNTGLLLKTNDTAILGLSGANTFTGAVVIATGTLQIGNNSALGATNSGTTIASGATLDVNGRNLGGETVTVSGTGVGNNGAIINNGPDQDNALRLVNLAGDVTFGGTGRWDIRESGNGQNNALINGTSKITKVGTNQVSLVGVFNSGSVGDIIVKEGILGIERATPLNGASTITVSNGATLELFNNNAAIVSSVVLNGTAATPVVINTAGSPVLANTVTLNGTDVISALGPDLRFGAAANGSGSVVKTGSGHLTFAAFTSYGGSTVVSNGVVVFDASKTGGTGITVYTNAQLGGGSPAGANSISENVTINGGGITPGNDFNLPQETLTVNGNVIMNSSSNIFSLTSDQTLAANDVLAVNGNLTLTGSNIFRISVFDHLSVSNIYTLITYTGVTNGVDTNHIVIVPPVFGYVLELIDPVTTPGSIQIRVRQAIGFDFWTGGDLVNPTLWDTVTLNWEQNGPTTFASNNFACFSDDFKDLNPNSTNITLVGTMTVSGLIFTNGVNSYKLSGNGRLSGPGELILEGGGGGTKLGTVTIANTGSNDFSGGVLIDANENMFSPAVLYVGDGTVNGNLGSGTITNDGILVFNHGGGYSNALVVNNPIVNAIDSGFLPLDNPTVFGITNIGSGVVRLGGNSTFSNQVVVLNGILAVGNGNALGDTNGSTVITNGATLDVNGQNLGSEPVVVSGNGNGGQGVIINNGPAQTTALSDVILAGDVTFGGGTNGTYPNTNGFFVDTGATNRWDIRAGASTLATVPPNSPFSITKIGNNHVSLVAITNIDPAISNIDVQGGVFAIQTSTTQIGDPSGTVTIHTNAALNIYQLTAGPLNKRVVIQNGGTLWAQNGSPTNIGPIILGTAPGDSCYFQVDTNVNLWIVSNSIAGPGSLITTTNGTLYLASSNGYTGNTVIRGIATVILAGTSLANSPVIDMSGATCMLDAGQRTDKTLTLVGGQLLRGNGTLAGTLAGNATATVSLGESNSVGTLIVTNSATLAGTTILKVNGSSFTNDQLVVSNTLTYGGVLTIQTNGTFAAGQTYQLFKAGVTNGSFSSINLPALPLPLYWTNVLANGSITVASAFVPHPVITTITLSGLNALISGTNGSPGGTFYVLTSTNVSLPLSNWTAIATNVFDGGGNVSNYTVTNAVSGPQRFYILQTP